MISECALYPYHIMKRPYRWMLLAFGFDIISTSHQRSPEGGKGVGGVLGACGVFNQCILSSTLNLFPASPNCQ